LKRHIGWYGKTVPLGYIKVGFDSIVNLFMKLLSEKGYNFTDTRDRLFCRKLVMGICYVSLDVEKELERIENFDVPVHKIVTNEARVLTNMPPSWIKDTDHELRFT